MRSLRLPSATLYARAPEGATAVAGSAPPQSMPSMPPSAVQTSRSVHAGADRRLRQVRGRDVGLARQPLERILASMRRGEPPPARPPPESRPSGIVSERSGACGSRTPVAARPRGGAGGPSPPPACSNVSGTRIRAPRLFSVRKPQAAIAALRYPNSDGSIGLPVSGSASAGSEGRRPSKWSAMDHSWARG